MTFEELKQVLNENSVIILYNANQNEVAMYDGCDSIPEEVDKIEIVDIFTDYYNTHRGSTYPAIGIELNTYRENF